MKSSLLLTISHWGMGITFVASVVILLTIYGRDFGLSIPVLIFLHILFVIMAIIFKISYVARLAALQQLGKPAH